MTEKEKLILEEIGEDAEWEFSEIAKRLFALGYREDVSTQMIHDAMASKICDLKMDLDDANDVIDANRDEED